MKIRNLHNGAIYESEDLKIVDAYFYDAKTGLIFISTIWEKVEDDWHYLEFNHEDLPPTDKQVIIAKADNNNLITYDTAVHDEIGWFKPDGYPLKTNDNGDVLYSSYLKVENVVAWKDLKKFKS